MIFTGGTVGLEWIIEDTFLVYLEFKIRLSQFQDVYSLKQIMDSPNVFDPLTKLQCCPTSDGSAAAILASEQFVIQNNLQDQVDQQDCCGN